MKPADLERELSAAALSMTPLDLARCRSLGLINSGVIRMGRDHHPFGVAPIEDVGGGYYTPSDCGPRRLIVPVYEDGTLIDLLALSSADPDQWLVRTGLASFLGLLEGWHYRHWEPVTIHRNPLAWLAAGGEGLCPIDWHSPDLERLRDLPGLIVNDGELAGKLKTALSRPRSIPPIFISEPGSPLQEAA